MRLRLAMGWIRWCTNVEKMLKDAGEKVTDADKHEVESALSDAKSTLSGTPSAAELNAAKDKLTASSHKLAEAMYKAASAQGPMDGGAASTGTPDESAKHDEGVIDAEYVDVDKK